MDPAECLRKPFDCIEGRINRRKELFPQAVALFLVPPICSSQIPPYFVAVPRLAEPSATASLSE